MDKKKSNTPLKDFVEKKCLHPDGGFGCGGCENFDVKKICKHPDFPVEKKSEAIGGNK